MADPNRDTVDAAGPRIRGDALGRAMWDYHRGRYGQLRYRDGPETAEGRVAEFYFTPRAEWADETIERLKWVAEGGGPVLDVGCGVGQHVRWVQDHDVEALGVDVSPHAIRTARSMGADRVAVADMFDLPVPEGAVEAVYCVGTQVGLGGSIAGVRALLEGFDRVTTAGGRAVIDNYDPGTWDDPPFGHRPDPRPGYAHRCFHFEYEPPGAGGVTRIDRSVHFLLFGPDRLAEIIEGTPWRISDLQRSPGFYRALLKGDGS